MQVSASAARVVIPNGGKSCYHPVPFSSLQGDLTHLEAGCLIISVEVNNFAGQAL